MKEKQVADNTRRGEDAVKPTLGTVAQLTEELNTESTSTPKNEKIRNETDYDTCFFQDTT